MHTELRRLQTSDAPALQRLFEQTPSYQAAVSNDPLSAQAEDGELVACPPGLPLSDKHLLGRWEQGELTAVIDLLRGYPNPDTAYLGLLLVGEPWQGSEWLMRPKIQCGNKTKEAKGGQRGWLTVKVRGTPDHSHHPHSSRTAISGIHWGQA